jgi:alpha-mannosidase
LREVYHIKDKSKNDLNVDTLALKEDEDNIYVCYLLEMACQEMFGAFKGDNMWGSVIDPEREYELKKCEIGLFNPKIEKYFYDIQMIRDAAKLIDQKQTSKAHEYLNFVYDMANNYPMPIEEKDLDEALQATQNFIDSHKNANSQQIVHAVGHCHIDTAWLWPYSETKRKIARSWATQLGG